MKWLKELYPPAKTKALNDQQIISLQRDEINRLRDERDRECECCACQEAQVETIGINMRLRSERDDARATNKALHAALTEAVGWNWLDDEEDVPASVSGPIFKLLEEGETHSPAMQEEGEA